MKKNRDISKNSITLCNKITENEKEKQYLDKEQKNFKLQFNKLKFCF